MQTCIVLQGTRNPGVPLRSWQPVLEEINKLLRSIATPLSPAVSPVEGWGEVQGGAST